MATKIPTYKTQTNFRSGFRAPQLKDATVPILKAVNNLTQDVLDNRAAKEGKEQGFQDVQSGTSTINEAEAKPNTIRGAAYKEGARSSFVAKTKNDYESQLTTLYNEHKLDIEKYNKEKDKLRENILKTTPSSLQQAITLDFDGESSKYTRQIETNIFNREEGEQLKIQTDRLSTLSDKIEDGIVNGAEDTEKMIAEYVDTLNSLYNVQQKFSVKDLSNYSNLLFHNILNAEIMAAYKVAEQNGEGEAFIKKLEEGGYKQFIKEFGTNYGDEIQKAFPQFESPSTISQIELDKIVKNLNSELKEDVKAKSADRTTWETDANAALNLYKSGIEPGYIFDRTEMEKLGFSESTILKYETSFRIAESVYPTIIEAKSTLPNDNATNLKTLQSDYFKLQNKKNLTADDREQLVILGAKIDGVNTILSNQRKYIADGDINLLMDQAGITYDTSTVEGLKDYHKIAEETFGLDSNIMKVAPQSQLDTDAEAVTSGNYGVLLQMSEKYGEYFETFIVDSGLDKQGYITVAQLINNGNPALAEQMFNALNDMEENTKSAKNQHGDFTGQDGALSLFEDKFLNGTGISGFDGFGEYITGNQDQADDIINGARALWTQIYLRTGDEAKASAGVITNFQKNFNMFEYNGMKVLLPIGVDADAVTEQLDIFANNPQKKGIMTNSLFDINDFKEDFEDNTFDNYDLVIDGGTIKIINKENAMGVVTVFKKLPSGSGEFSYTNTISVDTNKKTDANSEEVIIKDTVDIWNYNSNVGNKKFTTVVNNSVASGVSNFEKEKKAFDDQQAEILSQTGIDFNLYEKYKAFDTNNDGNITGEEYAKLLEFQSKEQDKLLTEPKKYSTYSKVETLMFEYAKLQNPPIDEAIGTISKDATTHAQLQAISMYIKDGEITDWIIDYLSDLESFEGLKDKANAKEVLSNWNNNKDRKTDTNPPTIMSPIMALYDYVQDIEQSNDKIDEIMKNFYPG